MGCGRSKAIASDPEVIASKHVTMPTVADTSQIAVSSKMFVRKHIGIMNDTYTIGKVLGDGAFGQVTQVTHKKSGLVRACKSIEKSNVSREDQIAFKNEVEILRNIDHPNVIKILEFFEEERHFHIVTELCTGGELFDYIISQGNLTEKVAADIMKQLLSAILYCHERNIMHRDLKPENLLLDQKGKIGGHVHIKLIDFGTSTLFGPKQKTNGKFGTPYYIAPEILIKDSYTEKIDLWSAGVIMYIILSGYPPFNGNSDNAVLKQVLAGEYDFPPEDWGMVSSEAKDLIGKMLTKDADHRITAAKALQHPWFDILKSDNRNRKVILKAMNNLSTFQADRKLQYAVLHFITSQLTSTSETRDLKAVFLELDANGDGKLSREELHEGLNLTQNSEQIAMIEEIMKQVDIDGSGFIDYTEFLAVTMDRQKILTKKNLETAFATFDQDGSGTITSDEIKAVLGIKGQESDQWENVIKEVDQDGNGEIDLQEFKQMMFRLF